MVPPLRVRVLNDAPVAGDGHFVLYWMIAARRVRANFALEQAVAYARDLRRPLVVFEAIRAGYPHASDRLHRFVIDGMAANFRAFERSNAAYYPYVERTKDAGKGLLRALAAHACVIVTDEFPSFFLPRMIAQAATQVNVRMEAVDSNGILPIAAAGKTFGTAHAFRSHVQRELRTHVTEQPGRSNLSALPEGAAVPVEVVRRWPAASLEELESPGTLIASLPIDHDVSMVEMRGGSDEARKRLTRFVDRQLDEYPDARNHPDEDGTSRLSPYLHFGHIGASEIFDAIMSREKWTTRKLGSGSRGAREGWWGTRPPAEAFLDQLITWRELAYNFCAHAPDGYQRYETLPEWSRTTLKKHARDPRPHRYSVEQLEAAETHDELWNAAQRQLSREGWFHNYLRMLWGKKILEWSPTPESAFERMMALMDRLSLDGRNPNSYAGYGWVLGRFDRPWGPERPIFGTVRYMTSESARRKLRLKQYLERYGRKGG